MNSNLNKALEYQREQGYNDGFNECLQYVGQILSNNKLLASAIKDELLKDEMDKYGEWIPTDKNAGLLIGVSAGTMKQRRKQGFYLSGRHYRKGNSKGEGSTIWWNKNALLSFERGKNGKFIR